MSNTASYSILREYGVIFHLWVTRRHIPSFWHTSSYSIYQEHSRHIPHKRHSQSCPRYSKHAAMPHKTALLTLPSVQSGHCSSYRPTTPGKKLKKDLLTEDFSASQRTHSIVSAGHEVGQTDRQTEPEMSLTCRLSHTVQYRTVWTDRDAVAVAATGNQTTRFKRSFVWASLLLHEPKPDLF
jgi:hypothetical protein